MANCLCGEVQKNNSPHCERCYRLDILGLRYGASSAAIKDAHRTLVKVWHPDRFVEDNNLRKIANAKLADINAANQYLQSHPAPFRTAPPKPKPPEAKRPTAANPSSTAQQSTSSRRSSPTPSTHQQRWFKLTKWAGARKHISQAALVVVLLLTAMGIWSAFSGGPLEPSPTEMARSFATLNSEELSRLAMAKAADETRGYAAQPIQQLSTDADREISGKQGELHLSGIVLNSTINSTARAAIAIKEDGGKVTGCFAVSPPLFGSGPLTGSRKGSIIRLQAKSDTFVIDFIGTAQVNHFRGRYTVQPTQGLQEQSGVFDFDSYTRFDQEGINGLSCPKDSDPSVSSGAATSPGKPLHFK